MGIDQRWLFGLDGGWAEVTVDGQDRVVEASTGSGARDQWFALPEQARFVPAPLSAGTALRPDENHAYRTQCQRMRSQ